MLGVVRLDFSVLRGPGKHDLARGREGGLVRRDDPDGSALLELTNQQSYYSCDLYLGSTGQKSTVLVDTGLSDLWIMDTDINCLATRSKRDYSAFYRVVSLPELSDDQLEAENNIKRELHREQNERVIDEDQLPVEHDEGEPDIKKRADCLGSFCMSNVLSGASIGRVSTSFFTMSATNTAIASRASATRAAGANSCTSMGSFETSDSDSFRVNSSAPAFSILYGDGTSAQGFWGHDQVQFHNHTVPDVSFALVNQTDSTFGVFGIGLAGLETTYSSNSNNPYMYENFPIRLKRTGVIHKNVYSLYLNKQSELSGSVLFGAVDHAKYSGTLQKVPIYNIYKGYYRNPIRLDVILNSITLSGSTQNVTVTSVSVPALLDSGTTFTYLPSSIFSSFMSTLGATYSSAAQLYRVSCDYYSLSAHAIFNFSGIQISVPFTDLIVRSSSLCYLGVLEQSLSLSITYAILGDNFLRNAYVVYDLDDLEISMAQAVYTDDEDIEVVTLSVPLAVNAASYSATSLSSYTGGSSLTTHLSSDGLKKSGASKRSPVSLVVAAMWFAGLSVFALI